MHFLRKNVYKISGFIRKLTSCHHCQTTDLHHSLSHEHHFIFTLAKSAWSINGADSGSIPTSSSLSFTPSSSIYSVCFTPGGGRGRHVEESNELLCLHFLRVQNALSRSQRFQPNSAPSQLAWTAERRDRGAFQQHFLRILNFLRTMTGPPQAQFTAHIRPCVCEKDLLWQWTTTPTNEFIKRETGQRISPILWGGACVSDWNEQEFSPQTIKGTCEYDLCGLNRKC